MLDPNQEERCGRHLRRIDLRKKSRLFKNSRRHITTILSTEKIKLEKNKKKFKTYIKKVKKFL